MPLLALGSLSSGAFAASLAIDIQPTGGTTASGFLAYEATNQNLLTLTTQNYTAFGTTVGLTLSVDNLPDGSADFRAVTRNGAATDVNNDWLGVDTRNGGTDVTLTLTFTNLPAGDYNWLSNHHDGGAGSTNGNLDGQADYLFTDASGASALIADGIDFSRENASQPVSTFSRNFTSNGGPVSLQIIMDQGQGTASDTNSLFAFASAVTVTAIPEPSSSALIGLAVVLGLMRRQR